MDAEVSFPREKGTAGSPQSRPFLLEQQMFFYRPPGMKPDGRLPSFRFRLLSRAAARSMVACFVYRILSPRSGEVRVRGDRPFFERGRMALPPACIPPIHAASLWRGPRRFHHWGEGGLGMAAAIFLFPADAISLPETARRFHDLCHQNPVSHFDGMSILSRRSVFLKISS